MSGQADRVLTRPFVFLWLATFFHFAGFFLLIPVLPLYVLQVGGSNADIGMVISAFTLAALACRPVVGNAVDRVGRRPFLLAGPLVFLLVAPLYGLAGGVAALVGLRMLHGTGMALYTTASLTVATDLAPPHRRGEAMSWFAMSNSFAIAVGPVVGAAVLSAFGFVAAFLTAAGVSLLAVLMAGQVTVPPHQRPVARRTGLGLFVHPVAVPSALLILCLAVTYGSAMSFLPVMMADRALGNAGVFFTVYAVGILFLRAAAALVSDRFGRHAAIVPGLAMAAAAIGILGFIQAHTPLLGVALLLGFGVGIAQPAILALTMDRVGPGDRGIAAATFASALEVGIAVGAWGAGLLLEVTDYRLTFLAVALVPALGAVGALLVKPAHRLRHLHPPPAAEDPPPVLAGPPPEA